MSESLNVITAAFKALPKQFASPKVLDALKKSRDLKIKVPASDKQLYKFLETFAFVAEDFLEREPGLFHTMLGLDTPESHERQKAVEGLLNQFLSSAAPTDHIRTNVPELPAYQVGEALNNLSFRLNRYRGALDAPAFAHWAFARSIVEAQLLVFLELLTTKKYRACIYAGIISRLEKAPDLCPLDYADDLYMEVLRLMVEGLAEEFLVPGTASLKTRLRLLGARHAQIYLKSLIDERKSAEENTHRIDCGKIVSDAELKEIKAQENRERRLRYNRRSA